MAESYNIGDNINLDGEDLIISKINNRQKTAKLSNNLVYTFDTIKMIQDSALPKETRVRDLKSINKLESEITGDLPEDSNLLIKLELIKSVNAGAESGTPGFAFIPQVYDEKKKRKQEDETVDLLTGFIVTSEKEIEKELTRLYDL